MIVPNSPNFELSHRYPWMIEGSPNDTPVSWEVSFARSGLPLRLRSTDRMVQAAELSWVKSTPVDARYLTRGDVSGRGSSTHLTENGQRLMRLLNFPD